MKEPILSVLPKMLPVRMPEAFEGTLARALGLAQLNSAYHDLRAMSGASHMAARLLQYLDVTVQVSERDLNGVPKSGPIVVLANHPCGILEGAVLADLLLRIRPDVKFLANGVLAAIPECRDLVISVNPIGGSPPPRGMPGASAQQSIFWRRPDYWLCFPRAK